MDAKKTFSLESFKHSKCAKTVTILSAWGRGAGLAHQLAKLDHKVTFLDISACMERVNRREREGPFGLFLPPDLNGLTKKYLGEHFYPIPQGFSVLTKQGPLEFQGPLQKFFAHKQTRLLPLLTQAFSVCELPVAGSVKADANSDAQADSKDQANKLKNSKPSVTKPPMQIPFFKDYVLTESSERHFTNIKNNLKSFGVKWLACTSTQEVKKEIVEQTSTHKAKNPQNLFWTLSGPETKRYFPDYMPALFPKWQVPSKIWLKFSLKAESKEVPQRVIPLILLILPEQGSLKDVMILKRHPHSLVIDLWMLCPYALRFNKKALCEKLNVAQKHLQTFFPGFLFQGNMPSDKTPCPENFIMYKNPVSLTKKFICEKKTCPVFFLNPEAMGYIDTYSLNHRII